jgi:hypothetical protein
LEFDNGWIFNNRKENRVMYKIGPKVRKGAGSIIHEASAAETASPDQSKEKIIMNKQVNLTPAQMVEILKKGCRDRGYPDTEVRLSREGDPELSTVSINFYPQSSQSKTNTPPEQSGNLSPQENLVKELEARGIKTNVFSREALHKRQNDNLKPGEWPRE